MLNYFSSLYNLLLFVGAEKCNNLVITLYYCFLSEFKYQIATLKVLGIGVATSLSICTKEEEPTRFGISFPIYPFCSECYPFESSAV